MSLPARNRQSLLDGPGRPEAQAEPGPSGGIHRILRASWPSPASARKPPRQRDQVHARGRRHRPLPRANRFRRRPARLRHRLRHRPRRPASRLPTLLAVGLQPHPSRQRPRSRSRQGHRHLLRRHHRLRIDARARHHFHDHASVNARALRPRRGFGRIIPDRIQGAERKWSLTITRAL